jgi:GGDEF domain-containing protein
MLPREIQLSQRNQRCLTAAMLDIDHYKQFNDTPGHELGMPFGPPGYRVILLRRV